jgi:uncharacterized protein (DUF433 family)
MAVRSTSVQVGFASINPSWRISAISPLTSVRHLELGDDTYQKDNGFEAFAAAIRAELEPEGVLETLLVDRLILDAWHLHTADSAEAAAIEKAALRPTKSSPRPALSSLRRDGRRARLALEKAIGLLLSLRDRSQPCWGRSTPSASRPEASPAAPVDRDDCNHDHDDYSNEWPILPRGPHTDIEDTEDEFTTSESVENWQDRLVFDFNVSETSPVIKGTWVTVSHVVSLIVDGWTWGDILRTHPELTEDDIRICLSYTIAQDNGEA